MIDRNKKQAKNYDENQANQTNHLNNDIVLMTQTEDSQPSNIYNKMSYMEKSVKEIYDTFQQMIPIINRSATENTYRNSNKREPTKSKIKILQFFDEDDYISRTSSPLASSSSITNQK